MIKISPELEWFRPYLKRIEGIVPVHKLEKVICIRMKLDKVQRIHGQLMLETWEQWGSDRRFSRWYISLYIDYAEILTLKPLKRKIKPYTKLDLLSALAHELAHLKYEHHTPVHRKLENRINNIFMTMLENDGYVSEEHEMIHDRPKYKK